MRFGSGLIIFAGFFLLSGCITIDLSETNTNTETINGNNETGSVTTKDAVSAPPPNILTP